MPDKYLIVQAIYEFVKDDTNLILRIINRSEIIVRRIFPWNEIVNHLHEFENERLLTIKQLFITAISITAQGMHK